MTQRTVFDVNKVVAQNLKFYHSIKPTGQKDSYTVIATLNDANTSQLLALASGTQASLKQYDNDIEDCHAESLLKRAFKRYVLDRILLAIKEEKTSNYSSVKARLTQVIDQINQQDLVLFVSQFPCGLVKRFDGREPIDERTGTVVVRKPGRGQVINGKLVYVDRDNCLNKLKRWTSSYGFSGRSISERLGIKSKLTKLVIGDCEPNLALNYTSHLDLLSQELSASSYPIQFELVRMRQEEFTFGSNGKQPLPVATVWWASTAKHHGPRDTLEYVVDGRRRGVTKKQCMTNDKGLMLRSSDICLRSDLEQIALGT